MKISLKELLAGVCSRVDFDYTIDLSKEEINFEFPFRKPVRISGSISDKAGVLTLRADIAAQAFGHCARCGGEISYPKNVLAEFTLIQSDDGTADEADGVFVVGTEVDLDEILVPELFLNMDMVVLCKEDCKGICLKCGANLNEGSCGCVSEKEDSPFAVLKQFIKEDNNNVLDT